MAFLRLFRSETFRLLAMGFVLGTAGVALTQPSQAQADSAVATPAR